MGFLAGLRLYDRKSSNNAARIRMWLYARSLQHQIEVEDVTHEMQLLERFRKVNPQAKIPALTTPWKPGLVYESSVILEYLERAFLEENGLDGSVRFLPKTVELQTLMNLIIRTHDVYIASPNSTQPGSSHTQGCMYLPTQGRRKIEAKEREAKLAELWKQLGGLDKLIVSPYCCGTEVSLADFTIFPTLVYCEYFLPAVFGWTKEAVFHEKPSLRKWYTETMQQLEYAKRVKAELVEAIQRKPVGDIVDLVNTTQESFKWTYP